MKLRKRAQTEKARCKKLVNMVQRHFARDVPFETSSGVTSEGTTFMFGLQKGGGGTKEMMSSSRDHRRSIFAYLTTVISKLHHVFQEAPVQHAVGSCIVDDFSIKLSAQKRSGAAVTWATMNNVQYIYMQYCSGKCLFRLFQPICTLLETTTTHLYAAFKSWLLIHPSSVGCRLQQWGLPRTILHPIPLKVLCLTTDSLVANKSMFNLFCQQSKKSADAAYAHASTHAHAQDAQAASQVLGLHYFCAIHQICLIRRPLVLGIPGYWSALVRLGHLSELQSFRSKFRKCLTRVIVDSFNVVPVEELPPECGIWRNRSAAIFASSSLEELKEQIQARAVMLQIDNSDPGSSKITHYCKGTTCHSSHEAVLAQYIDACLCLITCFFKARSMSFSFQLRLSLIIFFTDTTQHTCLRSVSHVMMSHKTHEA